MTLDVDLVLLAIGFTGVEADDPVYARLGARAERRAHGAVDARFATAVDGVWPCGDCVRGADLIVTAIADGREAARSVDRALQGATRCRAASPSEWRCPRIRSATRACACATLTVLSDAWYKLSRGTFDFQGSDGEWSEQQREVYDRGNGAMILLRDETRDTVLLTRQFRLPVYLNGHADGMLIEAPAGLLDGDDPETAIRREAEEETGYRVEAVERIGEYFMSPGS